MGRGSREILKKYRHNKEEEHHLIRSGPGTRYFDYMAERLSVAVVKPEDKLMYAMLKPLGIEPGKSFKPDAQARGILQCAADTGAAMIARIAFASRVGPEPIWLDRRWEGIISVTTPDMSTPQHAELSSCSTLKQNADGTIDLCFAPTEPVLDGTWKLNDIETVK
jgi:hypothetical protein